ncbi:MAG: hypothetical protein ACW980_24150 [Promethearchaeota archaeon]|jgi:hypothetical protein
MINIVRRSIAILILIALAFFAYDVFIYDDSSQAKYERLLQSRR